jgi:hypothetical protein
MSRNKTDNTSEIGTEATIDAPVGRMRLLPMVVFGVRASALARVALPVAVLTAGMIAGGPAAGAENLVTMDTTCCPPVES